MLTRWNDLGNLGRFVTRDPSPFETLDELRREMNRLFFDYDRAVPEVEGASSARSWPLASLEDNGSAIVLRAEVPGLSEPDVELTVDDRTVTIKGERRDEVPEGYSVHRKERSAYRFARSVALPTKIDTDKVEARLKQGVLVVTLPKAKEAQPRQINVRAG